MTHALRPILAWLLLASPAIAQDDQPLSAIDWLSQSVAPAMTDPVSPTIDEPPVANSASSPEVRVTSLDNASPDPVGLLASATTGLPSDLWANSDEATLATLVRAQKMPTLPALQELMKVLMLAEADAPLDAGPDGALFLARVDKLLDIGALPQAQALLELADPETPALFRRWFDVALLTGTEDNACIVMENRPSVAPTYPARIFCLARSGDWPAAALTLNTHRVLGDVTDEEEALLSRFLDPDLYEGDPVLPPPSRISPLVFRMREAIGEGLTTAPLPLAFAHADMRETTGWKAQLDAAERLARNGVLAANVLQGLYTARTPSASGGVWDRIDAFQRFDKAMDSRNADTVARALPDVWASMEDIRAEVLFAQLYAEQLLDLPLTGTAKELATQIGFLSTIYEATALAQPDADPFLRALAQGTPQDAPARDDMARAIQAGFDDATPPATLSKLAQDNKLGEALLRTIAIFDAGVAGDPRSVTDALALLRQVGLEDVARRASLQLMLLDRPQ